MVDSIHSVATSAGHNPEGTRASQARSENRAAKSSRDVKSAAPAKSEASGNVEQVVEELNALAGKIASTRISFEVDVFTGKSVVHVVDRETGELIRQVPPKELLHLASNLKDATGLIFNEEA